MEKGRLFLVAKFRVARFVACREYLLEFLKLPIAYADLSLFDLEATLAREHPEWGHLLPWDCLVEVALGDGTPIASDRAVPTDVVERIRFTSRRGERPIKYLADGFIKSPVGIHGGAYCLAPASAEELLRLLPDVQGDAAKELN